MLGRLPRLIVVILLRCILTICSIVNILLVIYQLTIVTDMHANMLIVDSATFINGWGGGGGAACQLRLGE